MLRTTHGTINNANTYQVSNQGNQRYPRTYAYDYRSPVYYRRIHRRTYHRPGFLPYFDRPVYYTTDSYIYSMPYFYGDNLPVNVQEALKVRGYYRGAIDGAIGPSSRFAIRSYQMNSGLPVTGRIDPLLLRSLQIG